MYYNKLHTLWELCKHRLKGDHINYGANWGSFASKMRIILDNYAGTTRVKKLFTETEIMSTPAWLRWKTLQGIYTWTGSYLKGESGQKGNEIQDLKHPATRWSWVGKELGKHLGNVMNTAKDIVADIIWEKSRPDYEVYFLLYACNLILMLHKYQRSLKPQPSCQTLLPMRIGC